MRRVLVGWDIVVLWMGRLMAELRGDGWRGSRRRSCGSIKGWGCFGGTLDLSGLHANDVDGRSYLGTASSHLQPGIQVTSAICGHTCDGSSMKSEIYCRCEYIH
jgi:hypothetical protein